LRNNTGATNGGFNGWYVYMSYNDVPIQIPGCPTGSYQCPYTTYL